MKIRFFQFGIVAAVILLISHIYYNRDGLPVPVVDEKSKELVELMDTYPIARMGKQRTLDETLAGYDFTWAFFMFFVISINFLAIKKPIQELWLQRITLANIILWALSLVVALIYWSIPQQSLFGLLLLFFTLSFIIKNKNHDQ